jgi:type I restriction enzyme M protein
MAPNDQLAALVAAVREMGGSGGNIKLREKLGWDEAAYDAVRDQAIAAGKVKAGSGRGGSGYSQVGVRRSRKKKLILPANPS